MFGRCPWFDSPNSLSFPSAYGYGGRINLLHHSMTNLELVQDARHPSRLTAVGSGQVQDCLYPLVAELQLSHYSSRIACQSLCGGAIVGVVNGLTNGDVGHVPFGVPGLNLTPSSRLWLNRSG